MAKISTGSTNQIATGQIVQAAHVNPILFALDGTDTTDIYIKGLLDVDNGNFLVASGQDRVISAIPVTINSGLFVQTATTSSIVSSSYLIQGLLITGSQVSGSKVYGIVVSGSNLYSDNTLAFGALGTIISGSGSAPIVQHTVSGSAAAGHGLTFGGSQFTNYIIQGVRSPRIGVGASTAISTASLSSGSFIPNLPAFTPVPATLLITSSDAYVMKVATNTSSQSFAISGSGFVGINTWTPREALDVQLGNAAIKNPTTTSASILYVENNSGRILDVTNQITNSIFSVQTISGLPIFDTGTNSAAASYVAVSGNGLGINSSISSSLALISGTLALPFRSGSTVTAGATDVLIVATSDVALPTATSAGAGRYYRVRNAHASNNISITSTSTVSGIASLGPTSASGYVSDGIGIWYSI